MDETDDRPERGRAGAQDAAAEGSPDAETDLRALAEDWIAIWQSEITAYLTDPETQASWTAMIALWAGAAQAMMRAMPGQSGFPPSGFGPARQPPASGRSRRRDRAAEPAGAAAPPPAGTDVTAGASPAAAAPDARDDEVRRLEQRVAELERRLAGRDGTDASHTDAARGRNQAGADRRPRHGGRARS
jgi:hypothetical protein